MKKPETNSYDPVELGLPYRYWDLREHQRRECRMEVLRSWFDPNRLDVFCTDVDKLVQAAKLWHFHYMRPARCHHGIYTRPNPEHKWTIVRNAFLPPMEPGVCGRSITHAPRGTAKSVTLVFELPQMVAICRPATEVVMSQRNKKKTYQWMRKIRASIQNNDLIHADFGGKGKLWKVQGQQQSWSTETLQFGHDPQCRIVGVSALAAVRGEHPIWAIIDDPETKKDARNPVFADNYFDWLLHDYIPIVQPGGFFTWITTINDEGSCANAVINGVRIGSDSEEDDEDGSSGFMIDERFASFSKTVIPLYTRDEETGEWKSSWEALYPVEAMTSLQRSMGSAFDAEMQGQPRPSGQTMFMRDDCAHGWARCVNADGDHFVIDLYTGECWTWTDFMATSVVVGGLDLADSQATHAQPGAAVFFAVRGGVIYILDAYIRKLQCLYLVEQTLLLGVQWAAVMLAVDTTAMQVAILPVSKSIRQKLMDEGKACPQFAPANAAGMANKVARIEAALSSRFRDKTIRFPWMHKKDHPALEVAMARNKLVDLAPMMRRDDHLALLAEVDRITDNAKPTGWNGLDAIEMAIRKMGGVSGIEAPTKEHTNRRTIDLARSLGLNVEPRIQRDGTLTPGFDKDDYDVFGGERELIDMGRPTEDVPDYFAMDPYG